MTKTYSKTRILVEGALMIALSTVLSMIQIPLMPHGGSITLFSMVPILVMSYRHGAKWGLFTGFVNSLPPDPAGRRSLGTAQTLTAYAGGLRAAGLPSGLHGAGLCLPDCKARPFQNRTVSAWLWALSGWLPAVLCSFLSGVLIWGNLTDGLPAWTSAWCTTAAICCRNTMVAAAVVPCGTPDL